MWDVQVFGQPELPLGLAALQLAVSYAGVAIGLVGAFRALRLLEERWGSGSRGEPTTPAAPGGEAG